MAQQIHLELLPGSMLLLAHLETGADQIPHRLVHRFGHINARQLPGPIQPCQTVGIPPVSLDPFAGLAWHFRGTNQDAVPVMQLQATAQGKAAWSSS